VGAAIHSRLLPAARAHGLGRVTVAAARAVAGRRHGRGWFCPATTVPADAGTQLERHAAHHGRPEVGDGRSLSPCPPPYLRRLLTDPRLAAAVVGQLVRRRDVAGNDRSGRGPAHARRRSDDAGPLRRAVPGVYGADWAALAAPVGERIVLAGPDGACYVSNRQPSAAGKPAESIPAPQAFSLNGDFSFDSFSGLLVHWSSPVICVVVADPPHRNCHHCRHRKKSTPSVVWPA